MKATLSVTNVKGQTKTVELGKVNLLTGPNGSGKSTILESLIVAIDGEHPVAGKTLGAICQMLSGNTGSIELDMSKDGDAITIRREFTVSDEKATQEVYIDGKKVTQAAAQQSIAEFMGGGVIRKLSPYRFSQMLPKERLATIAQLLPKTSASSAADMVRMLLLSGSQEAINVTRIVYEKTMDALSESEMEDVIRRASIVDGTYISIVTKYLIPQTQDDISYVALLHNNNKTDILANQADIDRITKTLHTHQKSMDALAGGKSEAEIDEELAEARKELQRIASILKTNEYADSLRGRLERQIYDLGYSMDEAESKKAELLKVVDAGREHRDVAGNKHDVVARIAALEKQVTQAEEDAKNEPELRAQAQMIADDLKGKENKLSVLGPKAEEMHEMSRSAAQEAESLAALINGVKTKTCPVCDSDIDPKAIVAALQAKKKAAQEESKRHTSEEAEMRKEIAALTRDRSNATQGLSRLNGFLEKIEDNKKAFPGKAHIDAEIAGLNDLINKIELRDAMLSAERTLQSVEDRIAAIKSLERQISETTKDDSVSVDDKYAVESMIKLLESLKEEHVGYRKVQELIAKEQMTLADLKEERDMLKKVAALLLEAKEKTYTFLSGIIQDIQSTMGVDSEMSNDFFGIVKDGIKINEKVMSGGERVMHASAMLIASLSRARGIKIVELEASEVDMNNVKSLIAQAAKSEIDMAIIATHVNPGDIPGITTINL